MSMPAMLRRRAASTALATLTAAAVLASCTNNPWWRRPTTTTRPRVTTTLTTVPGPGGGEVSRSADPVVVTGSQVSGLNGAQPGRVVAFRAEGGSWAQIPVQVDERLETGFHQIYNLGPTGRIALW